jgi:hypothetical protein
MKRLYTLFMAVAFSMTTAFAQTDTIPTSLVENPVVVKVEKVGDNGARFLPTTRRIDRNINLNKFV